MNIRDFKKLIWLACMIAPLLLANEGYADSFVLEHSKSGRVFGPFDFRDGEKLEIGNAVMTLRIAEGEEVPIAFDLLGYDGIPFGSDLKNLKLQLAEMKGVKRDKKGRPLLEKLGDDVYQYTIYRSENHKTDKSDVSVFFKDKKIVEFKDSFDGIWRWDQAEAEKIFLQVKQMIRKQWGRPTDEEDHWLEWSGTGGTAVLRLDHPGEKYDLVNLTLTVTKANE